ncbi:hypothetical protein P879_00184 [Paragonimus westermani]|uniref:Uncharacterized protein n=1 Tax=Paragonimus westermani TaxID=34504 RepID=A0A8T0DW18_9TREM|nr:hypothetical protein P879_00184 [Paragonimus westermani]
MSTSVDPIDAYVDFESWHETLCTLTAHQSEQLARLSFFLQPNVTQNATAK